MLNREGVQCFMARPYEQNLNGSFWDEFLQVCGGENSADVKASAGSGISG